MSEDIKEFKNTLNSKKSPAIIIRDLKNIQGEVDNFN